jgi:hypothetical protein
LDEEDVIIGWMLRTAGRKTMRWDSSGMLYETTGGK